MVELEVDTGHHHYLQLIDRLLDVRSIVDEDLTDVTAGELVKAAPVGAEVNAGDIIAELRNPELEFAVQDLEAAVRERRARLEDHGEDHDQRAASHTRPALLIQR